jgi:uncharacterized SAM-binding protein YcdF (DUF218 family)
MNQPLRGGSRTIPCLIGVIVLLILSIPVLYLSLRLAGEYLVVSDPVQKVDAVVVLSGGSPARLDQAVQMVLSKKADYLIITDTGQTTWEGALVSDQDRMQAVLAGVSEHQIFFTERVVNSTFEEAKATRSLMSIHHLRTCMIVTDPFHTRRTQTIFRDIFRNTGYTVLISPVQNARYQPETWFLSLDGWSNTVMEYLKLLYYAVFKTGK